MFGIGSAGIIGYVFKWRGLYAWFMDGTPMAIPTCIAFVLTGLSIIALCNRVWKLENRKHDCPCKG